MSKTCQNIYRSARESAGLTREQAAAALNLSVKSIQSFEDGMTSCCAHILNMAQVYDAPDLPIQHLTKICSVGAVCLPQIVERDAPMSVINLNKEMRDVQKLGPVMEEATINGTVTRTERFRKEVMDLVAAGLSFLSCHTHKKRTPDAGTIRGSVRSKPA